MAKFETGKEYTHGWIGDAELFTTWTVTHRTEKMVTIDNGYEVHKCKVHVDERGVEYVYPIGRFSSMCPVLRARM